MTTQTRPGGFERLSRARCEELLAEHVVGRIAVTAPSGPLILPVNYRFWNGQVVVRTSAYGPLADLSSRTSVAFEVDAIDEASTQGWSVLVRGFAHGVTNDHDLVRLWADGPQPWASGSRTLMIAVEPTEITGRSVHGV